MGIFRHPVQIARSREGPWETLEAVVDTGSMYVWLPGSLLAHLGVRPLGKRQFETADGRIIERDFAEALVQLDGQALTTVVVFGDEGTMPILGALALEGFGLGVDPVHRKLVPVLGRV